MSRLLITDYRLHQQRGFTLLEILVAAGLFSIFLIIILSIFSRFVFVQRRDIGENDLQEDLRFALELLNREVRTGFGSTFTTDGDSLFLRNQNGQCVTYQWQREQGTLRRAEGTVASSDSCDATYDERTYQTLTGNDTIITSLVFHVQPAGVSAGVLDRQGVVVISLQAHAKQKSNKDVALQSAITSRQVNPFTP